MTVNGWWFLIDGAGTALATLVFGLVGYEVRKVGQKLDDLSTRVARIEGQLNGRAYRR